MNMKITSEKTTQEIKTCPFCAEQILAQAVKCKHCGEFLDPSLRAKSDEVNKPPSAPVYMNAGGAAVAVSSPTKRNFGHFIHLVLSILTAGVWIPIWLLAYLFRDKNTYH